MSRWTYKTFGYNSSSWSSKSSQYGSSWGFSSPKKNSSWAYSTPKKKGTNAKSWGYDPERDNVYGYERKKRRFWIW